MSESPERLHLELENEINKRILKDSPNKQDIDYLRRKIQRVENDNNILNDEVSKLRLKLKRL
jgi:hypothetical protein